MAAHDTHVLIVDDYPDALDLASFGCRVSTASDGENAIALAEQLRPDAIVLDLELPGISGFEAARRLWRNPRTREIPLIAAIGYSHERQLTMARDAGFDRVMVKPVEPEALSQPIYLDVEQAHENG